MLVLLLMYTVLQMLTVADATARYFIVAPNVVRVDVDETIVVSIFGTADNVEIPVTLYFKLAGSNDKISQRTVTVSKGEPKETTLRVSRADVPQHKIRGQEYVTLVASSNAPQLPINNDERVILLSPRGGFVFIQMDKLLYTPSQRVDIRVVALDQDMVPSDQDVQIDVINPDQIIIKREISRPTNGFIQHQFDFPPKPIFGKWTVTAYYGHQFEASVSVQFEVKEYVPSKFYVEVNTDKSYIVPETRDLHTNVTARYVFGEPVLGYFFVKFGVLAEDGSITPLQERRGELNDRGQGFTSMVMADVAIPNWADTLIGKQLIIQAYVTNPATLETVNASNTLVTFSNTPYKFNWDLTQRFFKRGLLFVVKANLQYLSGLPASDVLIEMSAIGRGRDGSQISLAGEAGKGNGIHVEWSGPQGEVFFTLDVLDSINLVTITLETQDPNLGNANAESSFEVHPQETGTSEYLLVHIPTERQQQQIYDRRSVEVLLTNTANVEALNFFVIAGGKIVSMGSIPRAEINPNTALTLTVTHDMVPSARVVAYYILPDGNVIADALYMEVEERCENPIDLHFRNLNEMEGVYKTDGSNKNIELEIRGDHGTNVGLLAVDEAVFKLHYYHRLTQKKVFKRMASYDLGCGAGGGQTSASVFQDAGVTVLSNTLLNVEVREEEGCSAECGQLNRSVMEEIFGGRAGGGNNDVNLNQINVQSQFPKSWMVTSTVIGEGGSALIHSTLPDSVTTWVIEAVGISREYAMCVADPIKLQVRPPFFLDLLMPYSVQRYEQIEIIVSVFNYADVPLEVMVYLKGREGLCSEALSDSYSEAKRVEVPLNQSVSVVFVIIPLKVGRIPIEVAAVTEGQHYRDAVRENLLVRLEGYEQTDTVTFTLNPEQDRSAVDGLPEGPLEQSYQHVRLRGGHGTQVDIIRYNLNANVIRGTHQVHVSITGNVMGSVVETVIGGLDRLLGIPTGCGEQKMIRLGHIVYIYKYLENTDQFTASLETSAKRYISEGVNWQMRFRHADGSFSISGPERPKYNSGTWLTAFVSKVLCQAREFAPVDERVTCQAMQWLIEQRSNSNGDGSFIETYRVHNRNMTGSVQGAASLTAFVLISLLECECSTYDKDDAVAKATAFLGGELDELTQPYAIAITAYALALAESSRAQDAIDKLKAIEIYDRASDSRHWGSNDSVFAGRQQPYWYSHRPIATEVETTSYALLALLQTDDIAHSHAIINWLTEQENYNGGFVSTQDTVIALQALSEYANRTQDFNINLDCTVICREARFVHNFMLRPDNALEKQHVEIVIPVSTPQFRVDFKTRGQGTGQVKFKSTYFLPEAKNTSCDFELIVNEDENILHQQGIELSYDIEVRYLQGEATGMAILDVGLYTGYQPIKDDLEVVKEQSYGQIQEYEVTDHSIVFYLEEITRAETFRISFRVRRQFEVGKIQPVPVRVFDYYNPTVECVKFIHPQIGSNMLSTLCIGDICTCAAGSCGRDPYKLWYDYDEYQMKVQACESLSHFAYKVRVDETEEEGSFQKYTMHILVPLKRGLDDVYKGDIRTFWKTNSCGTPELDLGKYYLVIGRNAKPVGNSMYSYIIDSDMSFYIWPKRGRVRDSVKWQRINDKLQKVKKDLLEEGCDLWQGAGHLDSDPRGVDTLVRNLDNSAEGLRNFRSKEGSIDLMTYTGGMDIYFLFDASASISRYYFRRSLDLAKALIKKIGVSSGPRRARYGICVYASEPSVILHVNNPQESVQVVNAIIDNVAAVYQSEKIIGKGTATGRALKVVRTDMITDNRPGTKRIMFLFTDGKANVGGSDASISDEAEILRRDYQFEIYCIGVGTYIDKEELQIIASYPLSEHLFFIANFNEISLLAQTITRQTLDYSSCGPKVVSDFQRSRIAGGDNAKEGQWPWQVALFYATSIAPDATPTFLCGGSLIAPNWVLTAASCLNRRHITWANTRVYTGIINISSASLIQVDPTNIFTLDGNDAVIKHERYDSYNLDNDIALLRLSRNVTLDPRTRTLCIPQPGLSENQIYSFTGEPPFVAGWGTTDPYNTTELFCYEGTRRFSNDLKYVAIPVKSDEECRDSFNRKFDCSVKSDYHANVAFCAGYREGERDTCKGDSGGPVMRELPVGNGETRWVQIGITSWGEGCAVEGRYGVYTRLTTYTEWIQNHVGPSVFKLHE